MAVTPIGLNRETNDTLDFEVSMNTHSVDLSMDLAQLSILETNVGATVSARSWSGGSGHHVRGLLVFPASALDGTSFVERASRIILTIRDVDALERVFIWDLPLASQD